MKIKRNRKAEASTDSVLRWILYLAIVAVGALAFRAVFVKLSS
jgi:hypothetical protein